MTVGAFSPGFRFSLIDAFVLLVGLDLAASERAGMPWFGVAIGFVVAHFFLFCNVVRMERRSELAWALVFVLLAVATIRLGVPPWPVTLAISFVLTVVLVTLEMRKVSYHGVFWRRINPTLPEWWEAHASANDAEP